MKVLLAALAATELAAAGVGYTFTSQAMTHSMWGAAIAGFLAGTAAGGCVVVWREWHHMDRETAARIKYDSEHEYANALEKRCGYLRGEIERHINGQDKRTDKVSPAKLASPHIELGTYKVDVNAAPGLRIKRIDGRYL